MKKLFVVETISQFRHRYYIEDETLEYAFDTVSMEEAEEGTQLYLGETIVQGREVSEEEIVRLILEDEPYMSDWTPEKLLERSVVRGR